MKPTEKSPLICITDKGEDVIKAAGASGGIFPNEIHLLSGLSQCDNQTSPVGYFEKFGYESPTLSECLDKLLTDGLIREVELD